MTDIISFWFQTEQQSFLQALAERQSFLLSKSWKCTRVCQSFHTPPSGILFSCQSDSFGRRLSLMRQQDLCGWGRWRDSESCETGKWADKACWSQARSRLQSTNLCEII